MNYSISAVWEFEHDIQYAFRIYLKEVIRKFSLKHTKRVVSVTKKQSDVLHTSSTLLMNQWCCLVVIQLISQ